jgi:hypothetical protein
MSRVTTAEYSSFQTISVYTIFADALYGDNGEPNDVPGYNVSSSPTEFGKAIQDGPDSNDVSVAFLMPPGELQMQFNGRDFERRRPAAQVLGAIRTGLDATKAVS